MRQLQTTACQPHCGTLASNTRKIFQADATPQFLLATRTLCTASCAKFLGDETCHTSREPNRMRHSLCPHTSSSASTGRKQLWKFLLSFLHWFIVDFITRHYVLCRAQYLHFQRYLAFFVESSRKGHSVRHRLRASPSEAL